MDPSLERDHVLHQSSEDYNSQQSAIWPSKNIVVLAKFCSYLTRLVIPDSHVVIYYQPRPCKIDHIDVKEKDISCYGYFFLKEIKAANFLEHIQEVAGSI